MRRIGQMRHGAVMLRISVEQCTQVGEWPGRHNIAITAVGEVVLPSITFGDELPMWHCKISCGYARSKRRTAWPTRDDRIKGDTIAFVAIARETQRGVRWIACTLTANASAATMTGRRRRARIA